jgi:hypothetical protein
MTIENSTKAGLEEKSPTITLELLSKMTGFPVELISEEIFKNHQPGEVSIDDLRSAMLAYIDASLLINKDK